MNKYLRAISSNYIFFGINTLFFLIITPIAIHIMGEELYGLWTILNAILLFSTVGTLGIGVVVNKFASEGGEDALPANSIISTASLIIVPMAFLISSIIFFNRGWLAAQFELTSKQETQFSLALTFTALSIVPQFLSRIPHGYLLSQLKNRLARAIETGINITIWIGAVAIAAINNNLAWMTAWGLVTQIIGMGILFATVIPMIKFKWQVNRQTVYRMANFSGFSLVESIAIAIFQQLDRIIVGVMLGPSAAGAYSLGTSIGLRITMVIGQASEVMIPYTSLNHSLGNHDKLFLMFRELSKYVNILTATITSVLLLWIPEILSLWINLEYAQNYSLVFRIIILCYGFFTLCHPGRQTLFGMGKILLIAIFYLSASISMLVAIYYFSQTMGLTGAAIANGFLITLIVFNMISYQSLKSKNIYKNILLDLASGIIIPTLIFTLMLFSDKSIPKILITTLLGILLSILARDFTLNHLKK